MREASPPGKPPYLPERIRTLSIIIPTYNEQRTLPTVLDKIGATRLGGGLRKEIIVVDDHSSDDTRQVLEDYLARHPGRDIRCFHHPENRGKGAALHTGIEKATGELLIIQDADLEYDPTDYDSLLQPILDGQADVVYGSRFSGLKWWHYLRSWHRFGNGMLTLLSNLFTGFRLSDMETCYKLFPVPLIRSLRLTERGFGFEPEVTAMLSKLPGLRIREVGISYRGRSHGEGKKIGWQDGVRALWVILKPVAFPWKNHPSVFPCRGRIDEGRHCPFGDLGHHPTENTEKGSHGGHGEHGENKSL